MSNISKKIIVLKRTIITLISMPVAVLLLNAFEYWTGKAETFVFPYGVFVFFGFLAAPLLTAYIALRKDLIVYKQK